jgi:prevent-host-death family protein
MVTVVNVGEAKTHLSDLLARAERGEDIVVARAGRPVVRLTPVREGGRRRFGTIDLHVPDEFFEPLPEEELAAWE